MHFIVLYYDGWDGCCVKVVQSSVRQNSFKLPEGRASRDRPEAEAEADVRGRGQPLGETRAQILADKRHAQRVKAARKTAAMRTIASSKVSYLPDGVDGVDAGGVGVPQEKTVPRISSASKQQQGNSTSRKPTESKLTSGSAALEIANAFLSGTLGRQLLLGYGSYASGDRTEKEVTTANISHKFFVRGDDGSDDDNDKHGGGQSEEKREKSDTPEGINHTSRYAEYSGKSKYQSCAPLYDNKGLRLASSRDFGGRERALDSHQDQDQDEGAVFYSDTWRSTRGGWVADFGAPHTHTLSARDGVSEEEEEEE